ncbi:MAG: nucleoside triphosphate pyrophosphohydrolase [archaeon]
MAEKIYNKLVRDRVPEYIHQNGDVPMTRVLSELEFVAALKEKLVEEAKEVGVAESKLEILEELADCQEVINALTAAMGASPRLLKSIQERKALEKGNFSRRLFLEKVEEK